MGQPLGPFARERHPAPEQIPGGPHRGGIHIGLGPHAAAQEHGDLVGINRLVLGLAPMDGLHGEGVAQDEGNALTGAEVGQPVPGEDPFDADHQVLAVGGHRLQKRFGPCLHLPVEQDLPVPVQDAEVHGAGVQVDATIKLVLLGVESPEVSSSSWWLFTQRQQSHGGMPRRGPQ